MTHSIPQRWLIFQNWTGPSAAALRESNVNICSGAQEVHDPPVLLALGGELVVKCCSAAVDPVGRVGAAVFAQPAIRQVQHGAALEGLQAGRGNEAWERHRLFTELRTHKTPSSEWKKIHTIGQCYIMRSVICHNYSFETHISFLREVFLNAHPDSIQSRLPFLRSLVQLALQSLNVLWTTKTANVTRDTKTNRIKLQIKVTNFLQRAAWWGHRAGRGSRCCNTATRSSSYCWRACPLPLSCPTSPPLSSSRNRAPWTESRPWRTPICSGWGCW